MAVTFHFQHPVKLPRRKMLKKLVAIIFHEEGTKFGKLDIVFCNDLYLLEINRTYLSHDHFTDIITFDYSETDTKIGEIYISVETANANASLYKVLLFNELIRLIVHGSLHLCGYTDKTKPNKFLMTQKENHYLAYFEKMINPQ